MLADLSGPSGHEDEDDEARIDAELAFDLSDVHRQMDDDELAIAQARRDAAAAPPRSRAELGEPPEMGSLDYNLDYMRKREVYKARMSLYCKAIEDSFAAGANEGHLAWWAAVPTPAADEDGVPRLATILPLVFDVTGDHFLNPDTWRLSHWLPALRLSRAMASATYEILSHAVVGLELSDLDPASARTLLSRCTRVNHLEMSLNEYGMMPFKMRSSSRPFGDQTQRGLLEDTKGDWLKAGGADAVLEAVSATLRTLIARNLTWTDQAGPHESESAPSGHFDVTEGLWKLYETDEYESMEEYLRVLGNGAIIQRGLSDVGLSHLSNLEFVDVSGCQCISDAGVRALCERSPRLEYLSVARCVNITDAALVDLPDLCPQLKELDVARCVPAIDDPARHGPTIGAAGLEAMRRCAQLQALNLDGHWTCRDLDVVHELVTAGIRVSCELYHHDDEY